MNRSGRCTSWPFSRPGRPATTTACGARGKRQRLPRSCVVRARRARAGKGEVRLPVLRRHARHLRPLQGRLRHDAGRGGQMGLLDPMPVLAIMARVTRHIGLGATMSTTYFNPYHIARLLGTLDHLSKGRMAWNVVCVDQPPRGAQLRPGAAAGSRHALRPRGRGAGGVRQAVGELGRRRPGDGQGARRLRRPVEDPLRELRGPMDQDARPAHRAPEPAGPAGDHAGRRVRPRPRVRRALGGDDLHAPAHQGRHAGVLRRHQGTDDGAGPSAGGMRHPAVARPDHRRDRIDRAREAGLRQRAGSIPSWRSPWSPRIWASTCRSTRPTSRSRASSSRPAREARSRSSCRAPRRMG